MKRLIALLCFLPLFGISQIPDYKPNTYVNDFTGTLLAEQIKVLNDTLLSLEKKTSVQFAIILINELPENISIEEYSIGIGTKWHVGNARNGLVYVAAINQRKQRLEVGRALEGDIPDISAGEITDALKPFFREKDYFGGLLKLIEGVNARVDPVAKEQLALAAQERKKKHEKTMEEFYAIVLWLLAIGAVGGLFWWFVYRPKQIARRKREQEEYEAAQKKMKEEIAAAFQYKHNKVGVKSSLTIPPVTPKKSYTHPKSSYTPPSNNSYGSYSSGSSSSSSSSSSNDSSYGNWGSGSSDSSSCYSSGFGGGGSSNDW